MPRYGTLAARKNVPFLTRTSNSLPTKRCKPDATAIYIYTHTLLQTTTRRLPPCQIAVRFLPLPVGLGMKTVGNGRENFSTVLATVFFGRERKRERENRTGKRNRYYGISGTESIGREHADYDRESITQNGKIHTTTSNI